MFGQGNPLFVDRRVFDKKGYWKNPQQDISENIYYFISTPKSMSASFDSSRQTIRESLQITIFGEKPIAIRDIITLADGTQYKVAEVPVVNFYEPNILIKDMVKQRIESQVLTLE